MQIRHLARLTDIKQKPLERIPRLSGIKDERHARVGRQKDEMGVPVKTADFVRLVPIKERANRVILVAGPQIAFLSMSFS